MPNRLPPSSESTDPARLNPAQDLPEMEPSGISRLRLRSSKPRTFSKTFELALVSFGDGLRVNSFREYSLSGVCGRESKLLLWDTDFGCLTFSSNSPGTVSWYSVGTTIFFRKLRGVVEPERLGIGEVEGRLTSLGDGGGRTSGGDSLEKFSDWLLKQMI